MGPAGKGWESAGLDHLPVCSPVKSPGNSAWQQGRKSQGTSQLPVVLLRPTDISGPDTHPPLSSQTSTEDADARPPASLGSTLAQSRAPEGSCFSTASPSSGVTGTGTPVHHVPTNPLLPKGRTSVKPPFPAHGDDGSWRCPSRAPTGAQACCGQL